jgi:hypothetical protein
VQSCKDSAWGDIHGRHGVQAAFADEETTFLEGLKQVVWFDRRDDET